MLFRSLILPFFSYLLNKRMIREAIMINGVLCFLVAVVRIVPQETLDKVCAPSDTGIAQNPIQINENQNLFTSINHLFSEISSFSRSNPHCIKRKWLLHLGQFLNGICGCICCAIVGALTAWPSFARLPGDVRAPSLPMPTVCTKRGATMAAAWLIGA